MNQENNKLRGDQILNIKIRIPSINEFSQNSQKMIKEIFENI